MEAAKGEHQSLEEVKKKGRQLRSTNKEKIWFAGVLDATSLQAVESQIQSVGVVYDERMSLHQCDYDPGHPETPQRIQAIWERCKHYGLIERCLMIPAREATESEVSMYHDIDYLSLLDSTHYMRVNHRKEAAAKFDGVYFNRKSYESIKVAAGAAIELIDHILNLKVRNGFAIIRPPGHHAMVKDACGYCFVNNVVIAAKHALANHGINRILIVDFDVHHGQGTQKAFYDDPRVLYFSVHRYEHGAFWPNLRESDYDHIGQDRGRGYNINVPFNQTGMTDADYIAIFQHILLPVAYQFNPNLVIVSAGYDAALGDAEGESELTPAGYVQLIHMLKPLANGRMAVILEGGYCIKSLAESAALTLRELLDEPCPILPPLPAPLESTQESILQVLRVLRPYWSNLDFQSDADDPLELPEYFVNIEIPKRGITFDRPENRPETFDVIGDYISHDKETMLRYDTVIDAIIKQTKLLSNTHRTCVTYDERMRLHKCTSSSSHPERPDRITRIYEKHEESGLLQRCHRINARVATEEELALVHGSAYIEEVRGFQYKNIEELHSMEREFNSVYLSQEAYECSALAVGSTLNVVDSVLTSESGSGVAIVRPPGHHAESDFCMGFCLFNTVATSARYAQQKYGVKRVLILDWDVHHGNGTQNMFYDDPSVLYISLHRYDQGFFFPAGGGGDCDNVGEGKGQGYNVNVGWNGSGLGDAEYIAAFHQLVMPIAQQFSPELVLVSAGFDAARGDPLGGCRISPEGFAHLTHMLKSLAMGRVILVLEGGYNLYAISESMCMCTSILLGDLCPPLPAILPPCKGAVRSICDTFDQHKQFWSCLWYRVKMPSRSDTRKWLGDEITEPHNTGDGDSVENLVRSEDIVKVVRNKTCPDEKGDYSSESSESDGEVENYTSTQQQQPQHSHTHIKTEPQQTTVISNSTQVNTSNNINSTDSSTNKGLPIASASDPGLVSHPQKQESKGLPIASASDPGLVSQKQKQESNCDIDMADSGDKDKNVCEDNGVKKEITGDSHTEDTAKTEASADASAVLSGSQGGGGSNVTEASANASGSQDGGAVGGSSDVSVDRDGTVNVEGNMEKGIMEFLGAAVQGQDSGSVQMFAVHPKSWCEHLSTIEPVPERGLHVHDPCIECQHVGENWVCLVCYEVHCSRYVNEHMVMHGIDTEHLVVLSYADLTVWCYGCDSYVHNQAVLPAKQSANRSKFNEDMPTSKQ